MKNSVKQVTTREIAKACGVSIATVSRVLNKNYSNGFSVRKELRAKICRIADELGYRPNLAARNLSSKKTNIISFIALNPNICMPCENYLTMFEAATGIFQSNGYNVCVVASDQEREKAELPPWRVDGVVVVQECSQGTIDKIERMRLPYVVINGVGGMSCSTVLPDDADATKRLVSHLIELGHKNIAYAGPFNGGRRHLSIEYRYKAYLSELRFNGLEPVLGHGILQFSSIEFIVLAVLRQKATAIIAYDYVTAMKLIHDANVLNIEIPKQVSIACFNYNELCELVVPSLTSVSIPSIQIGQNAAELLIEQIEDSNKNNLSKHIILQGDLLIRSSTSKPLCMNAVNN